MEEDTLPSDEVRGLFPVVLQGNYSPLTLLCCPNPLGFNHSYFLESKEPSRQPVLVERGPDKREKAA